MDCDYSLDLKVRTCLKLLAGNYFKKSGYAICMCRIVA